MFRGVPVFRGVPECSGVPVFRCSGVPVFPVLVHADEHSLLAASHKAECFAQRNCPCSSKSDRNKTSKLQTKPELLIHCRTGFWEW